MTGSTWTGNESKKYTPVVIATYGMTCHLCMSPIASMGEVSVDHVVPRNKGGVDAIENLRPAHRRCNYSRGDKDIAEWQRNVQDHLSFFKNIPH